LTNDLILANISKRRKTRKKVIPWLEDPLKIVSYKKQPLCLLLALTTTIKTE
jgi:hypothetical protein